MRSLGRHRVSHQGSSGFTLLEVLLTSLLASIILLTLWSLSDIYLRMFASGQRKIEETQLVRGLTNKLANDLAEVIQLPDERPSPFLLPRMGSIDADLPFRATPNLGDVRPPGSMGPNGPSPRSIRPEPKNANDPLAESRPKPRFGLFGTSHALRLIVLESDPRAGREPTDLADVLPQPGTARHPFAPEIRTIEYTFVSPSETRVESTSEGQQHPGGLVRREMAWETWAGLRQLNTRNAEGNGSSSMLPDPSESWISEDTLPPEADFSEDRIAHVVRIEFQYFDGAEWLPEWDSWEEGRLPQAVEVLFQVDINDERKSPLEAVDESSTDAYSEDTASIMGPHYRQLIRLPMGETRPSFDDMVRDSSLSDFATTSPRSGGRRP